MTTAPLPTTPESLLPLVLQAMARTPDARLRQLMAALTTHLHQFVLETRVTEAEFERAVAFLVDIGQATGPATNEVILAADLLGVSTLVALLNNPHTAGGSESHAALLGPFWRAASPLCAAGDCIRPRRHPGHSAGSARHRTRRRRPAAGRGWLTCGRPRRSGCTKTRTTASPT